MLNEKDYKLLCKACDEVLLGSNSKIERVAISWLHILNEHPSNLMKYDGLFKIKTNNYFYIIKFFLQMLLHLKKILKSFPEWYSSKVLPETADVVIVSHLLNESQVGIESDFYFGWLPKVLSDSGVSCVVVLKNQTTLSSEELLRKWTSNTVARICFSGTLSLCREIKLRINLFQESVRLHIQASETKNITQNCVLSRAAKEVLSGSSVETLRFFYQIESIVKRLRPTSIVVTYEGHAWERLAFAAARQVMPEIKCIGYHHSILFQSQHAMQRLLGGSFDPDKILTGGSVTSEVLSDIDSLKSIKIKSVGTHRQDHTKIKLSEKIKNSATNSCLVIPDGTVIECLTIIDFVIKTATLYPIMCFIIRMHPVLTFDSVVANNKKLKNLPENIILSTNTLDYDFSICRWAIYRGSGAAIRSVVAGLRPFYIALPNELNIDPLFKLSVWKRVITEPEEFINQVSKDQDQSFDISNANIEFEYARTFCQSYFKPINLKTFCNEINN